MIAVAGIETDKFEKFEITNAAQLRAWLTDNHASTNSIWLVTYRAAHADKYVSRNEVLDELLCFHWIDGIRRKLDDDRTMQLIAPRKVQHWAKSYKDRFKTLKAAGLVHSSGLQGEQNDRQSGLWSFMDDVDALVVPGDLAQALAERQHAQENFDESAPSYRRNLLRWVKLAKTAPTRAKRVTKIVDYTSRNEKIAQM